MCETNSVMLENVDKSTVYLLISNCLFMFLFSASEYLGECKCKENSVMRVLSTTVLCFGKRFRLDVVLEEEEDEVLPSEVTRLICN